ncbi:HK97-gp10 family putative phage morphogenesis protein [Sinirhodobacter huangdaonensis]|uniref:HK97-gp10 family putative phage morphogenesis protein n=1 Tax=Paenirhodobacter huangdaonensis TaxID=2501515 RepID=UPI0013E36650|nr:HK97-gp10 family putative phage morphogenesis protein [Sinirhodobacter huangdaonensis]
MSVTIKGLDQVSQVLSELLPSEARALTRATVQQVAADIAKEATELAPTHDGTLKRSIKARRRNPRGRNMFESVVYVMRQAFYWRFLEYGQGPDGVEHAFMLRAWNDYRANASARYLDAFRKTLSRRVQRALRRG